MTKPKTGPGGARPGAGRPPLDPGNPAIAVGFSLPRDVANWAKANKEQAVRAVVIAARQATKDDD